MKRQIVILAALVAAALPSFAGAAPGDAALLKPVEVTWQAGGGKSLEIQAESAEKAGNFKNAAKLYQSMYESAETMRGRAWSLQKECECWFAGRYYFKAQERYKKLLESYSPYIQLKPALDNQRELARVLASGEASALNFKNVALAIDVYDLVLRIAPAGENAPQDMLRLAALQVDAERTEEAVATYRDVCHRFPRAPEAATARMSAAKLLLAEARTGDGDGRLIRQARYELERLQLDFPADPQIPESKLLLAQIRERQARQRYDLGVFYLRRYSYRPNTARRYFYDVIRLYPGTAAAIDAKLQLARIEPGPGGDGLPGSMDGTTPPPAPDLPPQPARWLKPQENVEKYLLPLEDYSDYLHKRDK